MSPKDGLPTPPVSILLLLFAKLHDATQSFLKSDSIVEGVDVLPSISE